MDKLSKIAERTNLQIEIKEKVLRLHTLDSKKDRTDSESSEADTLDRELRELREKEIPAIKAAEEEREAAIVERTVTENTPEERERRTLRAHKETTVGNAISQRLSGRDAFDGPLGEYVSACGVKANELPIAYFEREVRREHRAVTPAPALADQTAQAVTSVEPTIEYAFTPLAAASLGVELRPVPPGEAHFVKVTTAPPAAPTAKSAALPSTAGALTLTTRKPVRIGGQINVEVESEALFPSLTDDLDRSLASSLADKLDSQILNADGVAPNLSSLINQADDVAIGSAVESFSTGVSRFAGLIDGLHGVDWSSLRALIGVATFKLYSGLLASGTDVSLYDYLKSRLGSLVVSKRVPALAAHGQKGIVTLMGKGDPIAVPIWSGMSLRIDDDVTQIAKGIRVVTLHLLCGAPFVPHGTEQVKEIHPKLN